MKTPPVAAVCVSLLLLACLLAVPAAGRGRNGTATRSLKSYRLPNTTVPTHYRLRLDTDIHKGIFEYNGKLLIQIEVLEPTDQIVLHSVRSVITCLELRETVLKPIAIKGYELDEEKQFLIINVAQVLPKGMLLTLDITFTNSIDRTDRAGFYRSSYRTANGTIRYLGLTHFESTHARTAFPCYDEPGIKATFDIDIICGKDYHVRSNAPARGTVTVPYGDKKLWTFARTPRMQTYLVAWLVSDYVSLEVVLPERNLTVATWAAPTFVHELSYSVNATVRFIRAMEEYFGEQYTLPKIDNVLISSLDFAPAGMENWGLIMYRTAYALYDPIRHGYSTLFSVTKTIGHELTHQFFGNLLAPKWWSYLWLSEGFAAFYQYYVGSISHPEVIQREQFVTRAMQLAFKEDSSATVVPMTYYMESPLDIAELFGTVVYDKAACVLRMMNYALGEYTFRKGVRYYLRQNKALGVVEDSNLFDSLEQAAKEDAVLPVTLSMHDIFGSWSNQAGVPIVSVRRDGDEFSFTQARYFAAPQKDPRNSSWWIPISFTTTTNKTYETLPAFWMPPHVSEVSYTIPLAEGEIATFNPLATGYYRISYEEPLLNEFIERLSRDHGTIQPAARARLIDDTLNVAYRDGGGYNTALQLLSYLRKETEYVPWVVAHENLRYLKTMLRGDAKASEMLQAFTEELATPLLEEYSFARRSGESANDEELRSIAIELACSASESCKSVTAYDADLVAGDYLNDVHYLFDLSETDRSNVLYRLIVRSNVTPGALVRSLQSELVRQQRMYISPTAISKLLLELSHYVTEPSEMSLLTSVASQFTPSITSEIDYQLTANRRWIERNVGPLTAALSDFVSSKPT